MNTHHGKVLGNGTIVILPRAYVPPYPSPTSEPLRRLTVLERNLLLALQCMAIFAGIGAVAVIRAVWSAL